MTLPTLYPTDTTYDIIVIGAGHAGCEAALAAARVGAHVLVLTPNLDRIGFMPCNPSIGGPAKGHIVAEIDALGGEMARAIDRVALQIRRLNASKGPAVQALRAQADKTLYSIAMKEALERQPGVEVRQESAKRVEVSVEAGTPRVRAVSTDFGNTYRCGAVVVTAGTFLRGNMIAGEWNASGGRAGDTADRALAMSIGDFGIRLRRLKTGTPPRIDARTIDFKETELQPGSDDPLWFSLEGQLGGIERLELPAIPEYPHQSSGWRNQLPCYLVHTGPEAHRIILENAHRSPMFDGTIQGVGPRYCPSIEDKVHRFRDKDAHGLFLEPEGWRTTEVYVQGANTSLPHDVQLAFLRTVPALRDVRITRYGYAVEYDAVDATELTPWFAAKRIDGLFLAGQVNGTSGYEEAAGQGLLAGVNAARFTQGQDPLVLHRDQAYIGVMADDLSTQEFVEPYRMLTARAEHRLTLRADNADARLSALATAAGLITKARRNLILRHEEHAAALRQALDSLYITPNRATAELHESHDLPSPTRSMTLFDFARRPDVDLRALVNAHADRHAAIAEWRQKSAFAISQVEIDIRYSAYVEKEREHIERVASMDRTRIPSDFDYDEVPGFRTEAREKLVTTRPSTVGQASRIPGVTPADIAVLLVRIRGRKQPKGLDTSSHPVATSARPRAN
jgi:tRNA uridine 5-carboxymethylaminomethyl modification enzyme